MKNSTIIILCILALAGIFLHMAFNFIPGTLSFTAKISGDMPLEKEWEIIEVVDYSFNDTTIRFSFLEEITGNTLDSGVVVEKISYRGGFTEEPKIHKRIFYEFSTTGETVLYEDTKRPGIINKAGIPNWQPRELSYKLFNIDVALRDNKPFFTTFP